MPTRGKGAWFWRMAEKSRTMLRMCDLNRELSPRAALNFTRFIQWASRSSVSPALRSWARVDSETRWSMSP